MYMTSGDTTAFICHVHSVMHDRLNVYEPFKFFWKLSADFVSYLIYISNIVVLAKHYDKLMNNNSGTNIICYKTFNIYLRYSTGIYQT